MKQSLLLGLADDRSHEGYQFFAECLDEMLFEYTLDTYKPSSHNPSTLAAEAIEVVEDIDAGIIDRGNFEHIRDEMRFMISKDVIAKSLLPVDYEKLLNECVADNISQSKIRFELILVSLAAAKYCNTCVSALRDLVRIGREKHEIRFIARSFVTSLLRLGYTRRFVREVLREKIQLVKDKSPEQRLEDFFSAFDGKAKNYRVVFAGSQLFKKFAQASQDMGASVAELPPAEISPEDLEKLSVQAAGRIFIAVEIRAMDKFAARRRAEEKIERITNVYSLFHHAILPAWSEFAWVMEKGEAQGSLIRPPIPAMSRTLDARPTKAGVQMALAVRKFGLEEESMEQFDRLVGLHGAAGRTSSTSIQLLNLWSALESSVPKVVRGARVKSVSDTLRPLMRLQYVCNIFDDLLSDMFRFDSRLVKKALRDVGDQDGNLSRVNLVKLMYLDVHQATRNEALTELSSYPLLLNRWNDIRERFKSPGEVRKVLDTHDQRVEWQMRRIYRTRNLYVHSGRKVELLDMLVENAHGYLDTFFDGIFAMVKMESSVTTIDHAWLVASERVRHWDKMLSVKDAVYTSENVVGLVLGPMAQLIRRS
ncbi:hypothetical protein ASD77_08180 [Pseudoxanthomonas sp. Root65]|uniref:hypothetical protein n=1 Tax=Pseudoxanthomonas sp. Root65 TaxID=1736576 RepID=UPI0006FB6124|nr:hypothetical protein [Pseudoxanthomonas sp. Root65]KRA54557.1 hypothetical protein ASD77_08180 [Pseudoxanthomonas sp. Root65]